MARIRYTDKTGEHTGTLSAWEYYGLDEPQRVPYFDWQNTDYEPFKRAIGKKYNTEVISAKIV